jgi:MraZ protein
VARRGASVFVGRHDRQLDPKGRLAMPTAYRPRLEPSCFLAFGSDGCVEIWTREVFEETAKEATEKMKRGEISRDAWRATAHNALEVSVDGQGRINVDRAFRDYAGLDLGHKVVVAGSIDRVEIWNAERYESMNARGTAELKGVTP